MGRLVGSSFNFIIECKMLGTSFSLERVEQREEPEHKKSNPEMQADNLFSDIASLLSVPLKQDRVDGADESSMFAVCPWCGLESTHVLVSKGFLRKDEFSCITCSQRTSQCEQHTVCQGVTKSSFFWDDALCSNCEEQIQKVSKGEISLGAFLRNFQEQSIVTELQSDGDMSQVPFSPAQGNEAEPVEMPVGSDPHVGAPECRSKHSVVLFDNCEAAGKNALGLSSDREKVLSTDQDLTNQTGSMTNQTGSPSSPLASSILGEGASEPEPWMTVRDVILNWPGPEREDVHRYRELCSHKAWVRRWIKSCAGDEAWAVRRIFAHLKWRQQYGLDTIMDEVVQMP